MPVHNCGGVIDRRPATYQKYIAATRERIVELATREFAEHGIAGRIERIVATARTNKAQLYGYFGSKDGLFVASFNGCTACRRKATLESPLTGPDRRRRADRRDRSPGLGRAPLRLATWARLERRPTGPLVLDGGHRTDPI